MTRKIFSFLAVGICICSLCSCSKPSQVEILSPDGQIKLNLSLNENGQPFYEVTVKDSLFITRSALGLTAKQEINLSEGFEIEKTVSDSKDEIWEQPDRKSTRLNSSHANISYAVFCLKKKTKHVCSARCHSISATMYRA